MRTPWLANSPTPHRSSELVLPQENPQVLVHFHQLPSRPITLSLLSTILVTTDLQPATTSLHLYRTQGMDSKG
eukprot:scaffold181389_cov20-Tisochrysis_lutea.AAC.3